MNEYDVKRLALILAVQAEIEGMKVTNMIREKEGDIIPWTATDFRNKAEELRELAYAHDLQL